MDRERIEEFLQRRRSQREVLAVAVPAAIGEILAVCLFEGLTDTTESSVDRNELVRACGIDVLAEYRHLPEYRHLATDFAREMRKDCGTYGPKAAGSEAGGD